MEEAGRGITALCVTRTPAATSAASTSSGVRPWSGMTSRRPSPGRSARPSTRTGRPQETASTSDRMATSVTRRARAPHHPKTRSATKKGAPGEGHLYSPAEPRSRRHRGHGAAPYAQSLGGTLILCAAATLSQ